MGERARDNTQTLKLAEVKETSTRQNVNDSGTLMVGYYVGDFRQ
jgi:hypothetical protein